MRAILFAAALLAGACLEAGVPEQVTGEWGGEHLGMIASVTGATLEYDCAAGKISEPIRPDPRGRFTVSGEHYPGHGGPAIIDEEQVKRPARFDGLVRGDRMTLTVTLTDTNEGLGTFTLVSGRSPYVIKCL